MASVSVSTSEISKQQALGRPTGAGRHALAMGQAFTVPPGKWGELGFWGCDVGDPGHLTRLRPHLNGKPRPPRPVPAISLSVNWPHRWQHTRCSLRVAMCQALGKGPQTHRSLTPLPTLGAGDSLHISNLRKLGAMCWIASPKRYAAVFTPGPKTVTLFRN